MERGRSKLSEVSTNCKKCIFLDNLRTVTQKGNMETRQMTPFLSSIFSVLTVTFIYVFKDS